MFAFNPFYVKIKTLKKQIYKKYNIKENPTFYNNGNYYTDIFMNSCTSGWKVS